MKVLHLIDSGGLYGAEQVLLTLCREQQRQGLQPTILSCGLPGQVEKPLEAAARAQGTPVNAWRMKAGINLRGTREIIAWARSEGFTVLHSHGYKFNILLALIKPSGVGLVTTIHGYVKSDFPKKMWFYEALDRQLLRNFHQVCLVSSSMQSIPGFGRLQSKLSVIPNGIHLGDRPVKTTGIDQPAKKLLAIGRLSPEKGFDLLLGAVQQLAQQLDGISLTIMGEGGLKEALKNQAQALGISDKVHFAGFVANAAQHMADYDALVMPSRTEGLPITLLEALACGIPVFPSRVGGIPEVMGETNSMLLDVPSSAAIVAAITTWNSMPADKRQQLCTQGRENIQALYSDHAMCSAYSQVYQRSVGHLTP